MWVGGSVCAFCGAAGQLVPVPLVDEQWSRRLGGTPVVALDHGWYRSCTGQVAVPAAAPAKSFSPQTRALCDYCAHGWAEDVRTAALPSLQALAERGPATQRTASAALVRWAMLTAMLCDLLDGIQSALSPVQRDAVRRGTLPSPSIDVRFFLTMQRLPARVHLSQVRADSSTVDQAVVQIVSIGLGHLTTLVILPSDDEALDIVRWSALDVELGCAAAGSADGPLSAPLDLARHPHPHRIAVDRLCVASHAGAR